MHRRYGVRDADFDTVGEALLWALKQGLGTAFTPEVREAWATAYALVSDVMRDALADAIA
jgi:hemoglobin-like flavoprotein